MSEHIFKPGDKAYWIWKEQWVELEENPINKVKIFPIREKGGEIFMEDGKANYCDKNPSLLPFNPFDLEDPNNPAEFRSDWPFMLNGRPVKIGDELMFLKEVQKPAPGIVYALEIRREDFLVYLSNTPIGDVVRSLNDDEICWPDELPQKKKVAKWAYPIVGIPGSSTVGFTEEMTEDEARKAYGASVQMIPGTEREVV